MSKEIDENGFMVERISAIRTSELMDLIRDAKTKVTDLEAQLQASSDEDREGIQAQLDAAKHAYSEVLDIYDDYYRDVHNGELPN